MVLVGLRASVGPHRPLLSESLLRGPDSHNGNVFAWQKNLTQKKVHKSGDSMGGREQCVFRELWYLLSHQTRIFLLKTTFPKLFETFYWHCYLAPTGSFQISRHLFALFTQPFEAVQQLMHLNPTLANHASQFKILNSTHATHVTRCNLHLCNLSIIIHASDATQCNSSAGLLVLREVEFSIYTPARHSFPAHTS